MTVKRAKQVLTEKCSHIDHASKMIIINLFERIEETKNERIEIIESKINQTAAQ